MKRTLLWFTKGVEDTTTHTKKKRKRKIQLCTALNANFLWTLKMMDIVEDAQLPLSVLVLLVLYLWLGPMPVLWASTSNSLMSYMLQPTGWSGHSSSPAILRTVQPRLIFNTAAKRVRGLKCENAYVCVEKREGPCCQITHIFRVHPSQLPFPPVGC